MPRVQLTTGAVHYQDLGSGPPLLLLHANPGDSEDFAAVMPQLAATHRVLALDWPGYGKSPAPPQPAAMRVLDFYAVLREFLHALALPPAVLIGNSIGGNLAARLAAEYPDAVRGLVLVSPGGFTAHNAFTRGFCRLQASRFALSPRVFAGWYLQHRTPAVASMLGRAATTQAMPAARALNRALWRSFGEPENDLRALAGQITAPTLLIFGQADPAIPARRDGRHAARAMPAARLVVLPCGHAAFAELPAAFLAAVTPFLAAL